LRADVRSASTYLSGHPDNVGQGTHSVADVLTSGLRTAAL
jgi:hypothetical protein